VFLSSCLCFSLPLSLSVADSCVLQRAHTHWRTASLNTCSCCLMRRRQGAQRPHTCRPPCCFWAEALPPSPLLRRWRWGERGRGRERLSGDNSLMLSGDNSLMAFSLMAFCQAAIRHSERRRR
jgi:hypothetical protein